MLGCVAWALLQDRAGWRPLSEVQETLEAELSVSLEEAFARIEPQPAAAASLAQVGEVGKILDNSAGWLF